MGAAGRGAQCGPGRGLTEAATCAGRRDGEDGAIHTGKLETWLIWEIKKKKSQEFSSTGDL